MLLCLLASNYETLQLDFLDDIFVTEVNSSEETVFSDAAGVTVVWWQVGVCQGGDWPWPHCPAAGAWSPHCQWSPARPRVSAATCELWPGPHTSLSHNTFISGPSSPAPAPHNLSHLTSDPTSRRHLHQHQASWAHRSGCASEGVCPQILVFVTLPGPNQEKRFESEPSSQKEVKFFMVGDKNFMAP